MKSAVLDPGQLEIETADHAAIAATADQETASAQIGERGALRSRKPRQATSPEVRARRHRQSSAGRALQAALRCLRARLPEFDSTSTRLACGPAGCATQSRAAGEDGAALMQRAPLVEQHVIEPVGDRRSARRFRLAALMAGLHARPAAPRRSLLRSARRPSPATPSRRRRISAPCRVLRTAADR